MFRVRKLWCGTEFISRVRTNVCQRLDESSPHTFAERERERGVRDRAPSAVRGVRARYNGVWNQMGRTRKSVAVLCIALVVFAAFVPAAAPNLVYAILVPLRLVVPAATVVVIRSTPVRCDEQPASLLSLVAPRAPPTQLVLA